MTTRTLTTNLIVSAVSLVVALCTTPALAYHDGRQHYGTDRFQRQLEQQRRDSDRYYENQRQQQQLDRIERNQQQDRQDRDLERWGISPYPGRRY